MPPLRPPRLKTLAVAGVSALAILALTAGSFWLGRSLSALPDVPDELTVDLEGDPVSLAIGRAQPSTSPGPIRIRTCSLGELPDQPDLGQFVGIVIDPATNEVLFDRGGQSEATPASVIKIVTAAAALQTLGPDTRFETTVVTGSQPGTVVLVGGGDATLSTLPEGQESVYQGAPKLQTLAEQVVAALRSELEEGERVRITEVVLDSSLWSPEDRWDSSWSNDARSRGFISQVTALQVDGDRADPTVTLSRRSDNAIDRAGRAFVDELRRAGNTAGFVRVSAGTADQGARVLGAVSSQPVSALTTYMLKESDNTLAEVLARHVSLAVGLGGRSDTLGEAMLSALGGVGASADQLVVQDGSGLSPLNRVQPAFIASLLAQVYRGDQALAGVRDGLPISGVDGSLKDRFTLANSSAHGFVFAKTGSISTVRSLAGIVSAQDGTDLVFAFFSSGEVGDQTRVALENLTTGVFACGENLADF